MDGRTAQEAAKKVGSRYDLVHIAATRARELAIERARTDPAKKELHNSCVTALLEIEQGKIGREYLEKVGKIK